MESLRSKYGAVINCQRIPYFNMQYQYVLSILNLYKFNPPCPKVYCVINKGKRHVRKYEVYLISLLFSNLCYISVWHLHVAHRDEITQLPSKVEDHKNEK